MNAPKIRFNDFNDEWVEYILQSESDVRDGTHDSPKYVDNGYPLITSKNLTDMGTLDFSNVSYLKQEDFDKINQRSKVDIGDILFGMIGTIGKPVRIDRDDFAIKNVALIKEKGLIKNDYLIHYLHTPTINKQFANNQDGGTQKFIALDKIRKLKIKMPSRKEQEKIVSLFNLLDKKIELQSKKIEDLKLFKLYTENNLLNSNASINWKETKLSDILIEGNKIPVKNTNDFKKITIKLNLNGLEFNETKREMSDTRPFYVRDENEIIIGKQNYFNGSIAIVTKEFAGCICSNAIMSFKVKEEFDLDYIYLYLSQKKYMKQREFLANGTGQKELSEREFLKFTIKIPDDSTIKRITSTINSINNKINLENNKLNKLMELKKGLMQNMFV